MTPATRQRVRRGVATFLSSLGVLLVVSVGGNCAASLYRRSHLPSWEELAVPALVAVLGALALTVLEQWPLWRDRIPGRRRSS